METATALSIPRSILGHEYMQHDLTNHSARDARGVCGMPHLTIDITAIRHSEGARGTRSVVVLLATRILNHPV